MAHRDRGLAATTRPESALEAGLEVAWSDSEDGFPQHQRGFKRPEAVLEVVCSTSYGLRYQMPSQKVLRLIADQVDLELPVLSRRRGEAFRQEPLQSIQGPVRQDG